MWRQIHQCKVQSWSRAAIVSANPNSRAFREVEGSRFKRMFVAYGVSINGFILECQKILFVDVDGGDCTGCE